MFLAVDSFMTSFHSVPCFTSACETDFHRSNEKNITDISPLISCPFCQTDLPWTDPPKTLTYNPSEYLWMYSSYTTNYLTSREISHPFQNAFLQKVSVRSILFLQNWSELVRSITLVRVCSKNFTRL
jgi:hypothetical protein